MSCDDAEKYGNFMQGEGVEGNLSIFDLSPTPTPTQMGVVLSLVQQYLGSSSSSSGSRSSSSR